MSTIKKLRIQGVRSYSHLKPATIEFFKPLTIIVGANGSGKTTIIEALKFVTTGEQPPLSDKGKSFVHDPKIRGVAVVKGKVMLGFQTADSKAFVGTRIFQLTQKTKTKREYKLIDSVLRMMDGSGEEKAISQRCADFDKQVPLLMGVSKAVLENVIFCHQEDSNWPLSDSKNLKKKFDDIFAATRWTKAQESIYKLRKQKASDAKKMEANIGILNSNLQTAQKIESTIRELSTGMKTNEEKMKVWETKRGENLGKLEKLQGMSKNLSQLTSKIEGQKAFMKSLVHEKEKAKKELKEDLTDSTEDLKKGKTEIEAQIQQSQKSIRTVENRQVEAGKLRSRYEKELNRITSQIGEAKAREKQFKSDRALCQDITMRCCDKYRFTGIDQSGQMDIESFELVRSKLAKYADEQTARLMSHKQDAKRQDSECEGRISRLIVNLNRLQEQSAMKEAAKRKHQSRLNSIDIEKRSIKDQIGSHSDSNINEQINETEERLKRLREESNLKGLEQKIEDIGRAIDENMKNLEYLRLQQSDLSGQKEVRNRLKYRQRGVNQLKTELQEKVESREEELKRLLDVSQIDPKNLDREFKICLRSATQELRDDEKLLNEVDQKISSTQGELRSTKGNLEKIKAGIQRERERFKRNNVDIREKNLPAHIKEAEEKHHHALEQMQLWEPFKKLYDMFKKLAEKDSSHKCPLCTRRMNDNEYKTFQKQIETKEQMLNASSDKRKFEAKERKLKEDLKILRSLAGNWSNLSSLKEQYPTVKKRVAELENKAKVDAEEKQKLAATRESKLERKNALQSLMGVVSGITLLYNRFSDQDRLLKDERARVQSDFNEAEFERVENEIKRLDTDNFTMNKSLADLRRRQSRTIEQTQRLQSTINKLREKQNEHQRLHLKLEALDREKKDLETTINNLHKEAAQYQQKIDPIRQKMETEQNARRENNARLSKIETMMTESRQKVLRDLDTLKEKIESLRKLGSSAAREERQRLFTQQKQIEQKIEDAESQAIKFNKHKAAVVQDLDQKRELLEKINLMLVYREKAAAVIRVKKGILRMKEELKVLGGADLAGSTDQARAKVQEYQSRIDHVMGKIETQREQIRNHRAELGTPRLKNIAERHRRALIECQATKLALKDLELYSKALEKALMEFHSAKMAEINEVLRDYWQTTYCGNDIEEIQIQSNHTQEIKGRRHYNYRVVMKQRDTELDMRGRCSAGQKVLASLLIRLALAETFCTRCGVLALDEPTTNLDQANIRQFARALNEIIEKRAKQENFQIIIITHDEEFVDMLGQRDHCDYYYRVYKDEEQCSRIKQQPFNA